PRICVLLLGYRQIGGHMSSTARRVRRLTGFQGEAVLWQVQPPIEGMQHVITSTAIRSDGKTETLAFPADRTGKVTDWSELGGGVGMTHEQALALSGCVVKGGR